MKQFLKLTALFCIPVSVLAPPANAQAPYDEPVETLSNKTLKKRGDKLDGTITAIRSAGLLFASFDSNSDFSISRTELTEGRDRMFKAGDTDNSGSLSVIEIETWRAQALGSVDATPGRMLFDKNSDFSVDREEFDTTLGDIFSTLDKDNNGLVAFSELVHVFQMPEKRETEERPRERIFPDQRRR